MLSYPYSDRGILHTLHIKALGLNINKCTQSFGGQHFAPKQIWTMEKL